MPARIAFNDLGRQTAALLPELEAAALRVLRSGWFVLGPEVRAFEAEWAAYCGVAHCLGVASGTDALQLALRAVGVGAGDEVITVPNAAGYTGFAVRLIGARPVYADVDERTWTMDPASVERAFSERTRAVVPVHLYGAPARMAELAELCRRHGVPLVEDCAQAHGTRAQDRPVGSWGDVGCFSFYPTKNLGALGDGGAVVTNDPTLLERLRRLRQYGWGQKYNAVDAFGLNSRLDELQAALLRVRLSDLDAGNRRRVEIARCYRGLLADVPGLELPADLPGHVYHLFVVRVRDGRRDALQRALLERGIETVVHYPVPDYLQPALAGLGSGPGTAPVTEQLAGEILSLPCYPELSHDEVHEVGEAVRELLAGS